MGLWWSGRSKNRKRPEPLRFAELPMGQKCGACHSPCDWGAFWRARYSWAGICCSISRQALIFSRRQTQHKGSAATMVVSAPQTEHLTALVRRSGEIARLACSRISAGTSVSGFGCAFRFMRLQVLFSLWQMSRPETSAQRFPSVSLGFPGFARVTRLPESGPRQRRREPSRTGDISGPSSPVDIFHANRYRPEPYGCKWDSGPVPGCDFQRIFS